MAIVATAGCASLTEPSRSVMPTDYSSSLGIWEGQVWENPSDDRQGVQNIRIDISRTPVGTCGENSERAASSARPPHG